MTKEIKVITVGEITNEDKRNYAKALARALIAEYGKEVCKKIIYELSINL